MRISVVIPAYNAERTIAETLDSVQAQSMTPAEIIVVDDGSRDGTRSVLGRYAGRVATVFQENSGVSATRNRGVAESTGDWVAFCDADDVWHPDKLRVLSAVIAAHADCDLVFHDFWTIVDGQISEPRATHSKQTMFPLFDEFDITIPRILQRDARVRTDAVGFEEVVTWCGDPFRWLMLGNFLMPSTVAVRRSAFVAAGGFDAEFRYAEDTEFFLRFSKRARFAWVDASLAGYRRAPGTLLTGNMLPTIHNATRAVVKHCVDDRAVYDADRAWVGQAVARRFRRVAYYCLSELQPKQARSYATMALRYDPTDLGAWAIAAASLLPGPALRLSRGLKGRLAS